MLYILWYAKWGLFYMILFWLFRVVFNGCWTAWSYLKDLCLLHWSVHSVTHDDSVQYPSMTLSSSTHMFTSYINVFWKDVHGELVCSFLCKDCSLKTKCVLHTFWQSWKNDFWKTAQDYIKNLQNFCSSFKCCDTNFCNTAFTAAENS